MSERTVPEPMTVRQEQPRQISHQSLSLTELPWRPPSLPPTERRLVPGRVLGRYELLCPIAQGGMATIWVARLCGAHGFEKLVAVKTILSGLAGDAKYQTMLLDEASIVSRIRHPNVAEVFDIGGEDDLLYLVMEWLEGDSLATLYRALRVRRKLMPVSLALRVMAQVCAGLHAAHELRGSDGKLLRVVHRDVSPQNVLIGTTGEVKLIDFGIAKALGRQSPETGTGVVKGKVSFMAPEQALGQHVDRRADVWAVGVMLYQLLSGRLPYREANDLATLHAIGSGRAAPSIPDLPPALDRLLARVLEPDRDKRLSTAEELETELERVISITGPGTSRELADVLRAQLGRRIDTKRDTIDTALRAAAERTQLLIKFETALLRTKAGIHDGVADEPGTRPFHLPAPSAALSALASAPPLDATQAVLMEARPPTVAQRAWRKAHFLAPLAVLAGLAGAHAVRGETEGSGSAAAPARAVPTTKIQAATAATQPSAAARLMPQPPAKGDTAYGDLPVEQPELVIGRRAPASKRAAKPPSARSEPAPARDEDVFQAFSERE
jgi:eukaryotic-like serine/threonine-protein kinase